MKNRYAASKADTAKPKLSKRAKEARNNLAENLKRKKK